MDLLHANFERSRFWRYIRAVEKPRQHELLSKVLSYLMPAKI